MDEYEIVPFSKLRHVNIFLINISFRNFHLHGEIELFAVIGGSGVLRRGEEVIKLKPGSLVLLNSGEAHEIDSENGEIIAIVLQLSTHFLREYYPQWSSTVFESTELCADMPDDAKRLWELVFKAAFCYIRQEELFELRCISALSELCALIIQKTKHSSLSTGEYHARRKLRDRMNRIVRCIDENYAFNLRLYDIAESEGVSVTHLSHFFTKNFGVSFQEYLSKLRLEHAVRLMDESSLSISEIAQASGFSDPKYMTRLFIERFSCRPQEYRKRSSRPESLYRERRAAPEFYYSQEESLELLEGALVLIDENDNNTTK